MHHIYLFRLAVAPVESVLPDSITQWRILGISASSSTGNHFQINSSISSSLSLLSFSICSCFLHLFIFHASFSSSGLMLKLRFALLKVSVLLSHSTSEHGSHFSSTYVFLVPQPETNRLRSRLCCTTT